MTTYNRKIEIYGGKAIDTTSECIFGEHGITVYENKTTSYYIPYTSIILVTTTKQE